MRGQDIQQAQLFSYLSLEDRVPSDHPLRPIRAMVDTALLAMGAKFQQIYSPIGRPGIPPERLLRTLLLQVLYSVRSERQMMEQLDFNILYRWFVGLNMDDPVWDVTVFTKNRDRLLEGDIAQGFFDQVLAQARCNKLLSDEHFSVDGTLIEAWASNKSFRPKDESAPPPNGGKRNQGVNFRKEKRSNATHRSTSDPEARLFKKSAGTQARLCYMGHVIMENRNGLAVSARLTQASGTAEREACLEMLSDTGANGRITLGADKQYDVQAFVNILRSLKVTPHVAQNDTNRASAIDGRTTRHPGYAISISKRKRIEEVFGWLKTVGGLRKTRQRGTHRVGWTITFSLAAYNLVRMRRLMPTG